MSVLVSPVWVILVVVRQPVSLVGRCALGASFCRVTPCREAQRVAVHPLLLHAEEIGEGVVEGSLYVSLVSPAVGETGCNGPSLLVESAGVGVESAQGIVAVGNTYACILSFLHASGTEIIVVGACHARHRIAVGFERQGEVYVPGESVQSTDVGETELSGFHIVHGSTVDIDIVVLLVEGTVAETCWREQVTCLARVYVAGRIEDGDIG